MVTFILAASVVVLTALAVAIAIQVRRVLSVRAVARTRCRLIEREERLAELRMQRAMQDTVQQLFDATRQPR